MKKLVLTFLILFLLFEPALARTESFWIGGYKYYPLYVICKEKNIDYNWDSIGRIATLKKNGVEAKMVIGSDKILVNGESVKDVGPPLRFHKGMVVIPSWFANKGIDRIFKYERGRAETRVQRREKKGLIPVHKIKTIVLDPGHGGKDPGAVGRYYKLREKDVNLDIAKRLKNLLSSHGIKVYLTRTKDVFISLPKRAEFANKKNADFFISIHANSSRSRGLRGFEAYYLSESDDSARALRAAKSKGYNSTAKAIEYDMKFRENRRESRELSEYLIKHVKKKNVYAKRKSLRNARFHVLKNFKTDMPAVLVEVGYLSNKREERLLRLSSYRNRLAEGLLDGILAYRKEYERLNGFTR